MDFDSFTPTVASTNPAANQGGRVAPTPSVGRVPTPEASTTLDFDSFDPSAITTPTTTPSITERNSIALAKVGASRSVDGTVVTTSPTPEADEVNLNLLAASRFTPQQIADFKANPITWGQSQNYLDFADILPAGGVYKGGKALWLSNVAGKLERGEALTDGEQKALYAAVDKNIEMSLRGFTVGGGIKYYGLQMPAFMMEFAATAGVGKLAQVSAVKGAEKLAISTVENAAVRAIGRSAVTATGAAANITARTAAIPSLYTAQYGERRLNDEIAITDKGALLLKESEESPTKAALMAFAYSSANVASEMAGGPLGKYVVSPVLGRVKTPLIAAVNNVPAPIREALYEAYKLIKPNAKVSEVFTAVGWNGMLNELGENRIQDVMNATLGFADAQQGPKNFDEWLDAITPSKDQVLIEGGIIGIAGGVKTSASLTGNLLRNKMRSPTASVPPAGEEPIGAAQKTLSNDTADQSDVEEMVSNMSATEQEGFVNKHLQTPTSDLPNYMPQSPETNAVLVKAETSTEVALNGGLVVGTLEGEAADAQMAAAAKLEPPKIDNSESFFNNFYRQWINELDPIQTLPERARAQGKYIVPNADTKLLTTAYAGTLGAIRQNLQVATFVKDDLGNNIITGKGLKPILDDFSNMMLSYEPNVKQREKDLADYLVARRYLKDLHGRDDVEVTEAQKTASIKNLTDLHGKYGEELRFFDTFAKEIYGFQQRILHNLVDSGVMSKESYDKILKENPNYIPFDRVLDTPDFAGGVSTNGVFTKANANRIVKKIKGSDKEVKDVFNTIIKNTANIIDMSRRNEVARSIANLAPQLPTYIQKVPTPMVKVAEEKDGTPIFRPSQHQPRDTIVVRENGKKQYYAVSKPILEAIESIGASQLNFIEKALQTSATILRTGATLVPEFWVRNVLRDQQGALLQSGVKYRPTDFARGLWAVMGKTELFNEWERSGGSFNSYMELDDKGLEKAFKEMMRDGGKMWRYLNPINIAADISGGLEQATRIGVFSRAKAEGQTALQATLTSRDATLNFSRRGSQGKGVNRMVPFFNAGVQGSDKLIRTFKEHPVASTLWGLTTITLPSIALAGYYLYGAPDDEREEYLEIPQWQRDLFWVFKSGGEWHRYPKPFSYGYLFGSMPERMMLWMYEGDKPEGQAVWKDVAQGLGAAFIPMYDGASMLPPVIKTAVESISGYNFFTGRDIYPDWMKRLDPEERSNKYTSETAKAVGEGLGVSPAKVDNALRGTIAGSADYVTRAGDFVLGEVKKWNGEVDNTGEKPVTASDIPLVKAFAVRRPSGYRSNSAAKFFENYEQVQQRKATAKDKEGKEQAAYIKEHGRVIGTYGLMNRAYKQMKNLQNEISAVYDDPKMASERKVTRINKLEDQITTVARDANRSYSATLKGSSTK